MQENSKTLALFLIVTLLVFEFGLSVSAQEYVEPIDLMIITHEDFVTECERLSAWKNSTAMTSAVVSWQELAASFPGTDQPEKIKRGIADWHSRYRTKYVLLMGDSDVLPVRYITMDWNCHTPEPAKITASDVVYSASDLYYADLYNASEDFADWDYDMNGHYGELLGAWKFTGTAPINYDRLDMHPDVAVGRVPASTSQEVRNYVDKVISYETNADLQSASWLSDALLIANGVNDLNQYVLSGNIGADLVTAGFTNTRLFDVDMLNLPRPFTYRPNNIIITNELNYGKGFVNFAGHGNPNHAPSYGVEANDYSIRIAHSLGSQFNTTQEALVSFCWQFTGQPAVGDVTGDDVSDVFFFQSNGTVHVSVSFDPFGEYYINPSRTFYDLDGYFAPEPGYPKIGDFNGDSRDDIIQVNRTSGAVYVSTAKVGTPRFDTVSTWLTGFLTSPYSWYVGDFNGDSYCDVAFRDGTRLQVAFSDGASFAPSVVMYDGIDPDEIIVPGDFNGDFAEDIALIDTITGDVRVATSTGQILEIDSDFNYGGFCPGDIAFGARILSANCTGNGGNDLVLFLKDSRIGGSRSDAAGTYWELGDVYVLDSDGSDWISCNVWHDQFCTGQRIPGVGDFNGDSRDDIVFFNRFEGGDPFDALKNEDMYPVIFAASCSTAEYAIVPPWRNYDDTTGTPQIGSNSGNIFPLTFLHGEELRVAPLPHALQTSDRGCIMERFLVQYNTSGAVAYIGGVEVLQTFVNDLNTYFVEEYTGGENILGRMWNSAINSYLSDKGYGGGEHALYASDWGEVASYHHPSKVTLFGDPSLRVFDTPEPTTPTPTIPPPVYIVIIGGGFVAAIGIVFLIRRIRLRT